MSLKTIKDWLKKKYDEINKHKNLPEQNRNAMLYHILFYALFGILSPSDITMKQLNALKVAEMDAIDSADNKISIDFDDSVLQIYGLGAEFKSKILKEFKIHAGIVFHYDKNDYLMYATKIAGTKKKAVVVQNKNAVDESQKTKKTTDIELKTDNYPIALFPLSSSKFEIIQANDDIFEFFNNQPTINGLAEKFGMNVNSRHLQNMYLYKFPVIFNWYDLDDFIVDLIGGNNNSKKFVSQNENTLLQRAMEIVHSESSNLDYYKSQIRSLMDDISQLETNIQRMNQYDRRIVQIQATLDAKIMELDALKSEYEAKQTKHEKDLADLHEYLIADDVSKIEPKFKQEHGDLYAIFETLRRKIDSYTDAFNQLKQLKSNELNMNVTLANNQVTIQRLENELTASKAEIAVLQADLERAVNESKFMHDNELLHKTVDMRTRFYGDKMLNNEGSENAITLPNLTLESLTNQGFTQETATQIRNALFVY